MVDVLSVLAVYSLWLNVFGTAGNLIALYICIKLSSHTTFVFLAFNCASDIITLYFWNINNFTAIILNYKLVSQTILGCRIGYFFQFFSLENSAWLLVIATFHSVAVACRVPCPQKAASDFAVSSHDVVN